MLRTSADADPFYAGRQLRCAAPAPAEPYEPVYARLPRAPKNASPVPHLTSLYHFDQRNDYGDRKYPGNRLVARTLQRQWEETLRREQQVKESHNRFRRDTPQRLTQDELGSIRSLAEDIPALWHGADTPAEDRKEIVRALVQRVTLTVHGNSERVDFRIEWMGGHETQHSLCRRIGRYDRLEDYPRLRERIETLFSTGYTAAQIAEQLNKDGFHPPSGAYHFTARLVSSAIYTFGLSRRRPPVIDLAANEWSTRDLAAAIDVTLTRLRHWIKLGFVNVRRVGRRSQLVIWADADEVDRLRQLRDHPRQNRLAHYPADLVCPKKVRRTD